MSAPRSRSVALQALITLCAVILVIVTWTFTLLSIGTEERAAQERAESEAAHFVQTADWQIARQVQAIDQTLQAMAADWSADPAHFDPAGWRRTPGLPGSLALEVSVLDPAGIVVAASRADLLGVHAADRAWFRAQAGSRRTGLFVAPSIRWKTTGRWETTLSRRLEHADGSFAGVIAASFDPWALTATLEQMDVGPRGLVALIGDDGAMRALVSPYEVPAGQDVGGSMLFAQTRLAKAGLGTWTGPSAPDDVVRIHALCRLRDLDLTVVVGIDADLALRAARAWAANARSFAAMTSFALLIMAWLLVREVQLAHMREERLADSQAVLEAAYAELAIANANAGRRTAELEATVAGMSDGVMLLDPGLRLLQWNDRFPAYTGIPREILRVGLPMEAILRAEAEAGEFGAVDIEVELRQRLERLRAHRGVDVSERTRPNGRTLELRRAVLPDGGVVTLYIDITARKQAEAAHAQARRLAEEASEHKSRFVATVSHEIRTPLNAMLNSLALLDRSGLTQAQHVLAETAHKAGEALLDLVRDVLDLTGAETAQPALQPVAFEPRAMLDGVCNMFAAEAAVRNVRLLVEVAPDVPQVLRADRGRLRQVVMTLVGNAARSADPGDVTVGAAATVAAGQPALLIRVRDPGPRIAQDEADRLFQPFSRPDNAQFGGRLGLAACVRLVRLMGGQVGLAASPEGGNEFWLTLPLETPASQPAVPPPPVRARRMHVLLVEDLVPNQVVAATMLRREGHRVDIAGSGAEAVRLARANPYDLVLMDLVMPGMGGHEAARLIRALPGPAGAVPIVALTATTAAEDRARCFAAGMLDVLAKPVQPVDLLAAVARFGGGAVASPPAAPPPPAPDEEPVLDLARVDDLRRGLPLATLEPLVEECLADIGQRLPVLQQALRAGEARPIEEAAHALAGMAGNFGLSGLEARMRRIMTALRARDLAAAQAAADGAESELARSAEAIRLALRRAA